MRIYTCHMAGEGAKNMSPGQAILARKNLDRRLATLRDEAVAVPPRGWLKGIREALGLSTRQLATRMGAAYSRITAMEKAEVTGAITIKSMREAAEAMGCTFVYAIVPTTSLDDIVRPFCWSLFAKLTNLSKAIASSRRFLSATDSIT